MSEDDDDDGVDPGDGVPGDDDGGDDGAARDRFGVFVDPENVVAFLDRANINLDEKSVFHFLLTFPFYEHEWDIAGFIFDALFDDEDDDDDDYDEDGDAEDDDGAEDEGGIDGKEDDGGSALDRFKKFLIGGNGSKNFCLPCN